MRKIYFLPFFLFLLVANVSIAQRTAIKVNVLSPIVRTANFSIEQKINSESSFQLGFFYTDFKRDDDGFSGFGITPEYRFYLSESTEAINGIYIAPFLRYNKINIVATEEQYDGQTTTTVKREADLNSFGGGVVVGKQWVFKERITIDMFAGPRGMSRSLTVKSGTEDDFRTGFFGGFGIRAGITFGVAF